MNDREAELRIAADFFKRPDPALPRLAQIQFLIDQCFPGLLRLRLVELNTTESIAMLEYRREIITVCARITRREGINIRMVTDFLNSDGKRVAQGKYAYVMPQRD